MAADAELGKITQAMKSIEARFKASSTLGLHLNVDDESEFKRLALEARSILDSELGHLNHFSTNLFQTINSGSGGFLPGPSLASVRGARAVIEGGINQIRRKEANSSPAATLRGKHYVDGTRLAELRALRSKQWDLARLIRLVEELNVAAANECLMSVAMLVRSIVDHVPPIFGVKSFAEVANNSAGSSSFRKSMQNLNSSLRNIADAHLHVQIRRTEVLPTYPQVDFRADLDVLLAEVVRLVRSAA